MTISTVAGSGRAGGTGGRLGRGGGRNQRESSLIVMCFRSDIGSSVAKADSMAFDAVWPSPQIEASRMTCPISLSKDISSSRLPIGRPDRSR